MKIKSDETLSKRSLFYYSMGKKLCVNEFDPDGPGSLEKFFHQDILGNNILLTDNTGGWVEKTTYGPFGDVISEKRRSPSSSIQHPTSYKFTGKERDKESNLDYFGARYLDYNNGRWMKPDVVVGDLGNPQEINRWTYVSNNPTRYVDPIGYLQAHLGKHGGTITSLPDITEEILESMINNAAEYLETNDYFGMDEEGKKIINDMKNSSPFAFLEFVEIAKFVNEGIERIRVEGYENLRILKGEGLGKKGMRGNKRNVQIAVEVVLHELGLIKERRGGGCADCRIYTKDLLAEFKYFHGMDYFKVVGIQRKGAPHNANILFLSNTNPKSGIIFDPWIKQELMIYSYKRWEKMGSTPTVIDEE
ncbi:RHS repeat-associated core domain-containing protein [bacterium]|nr:RHS repeat-associated core domain-containing protein [bacterium]